MNKARLVVALTGGAVILASALGLLEIGSRAGPFESALVPIDHVLLVEGTYSATAPSGTTGPGGVCIPAGVGASCSPPRTHVSLSLRGAPRIDHATYLAFLTGPGSPFALGALTWRGDALALEFSRDEDSRARIQLVVTLERGAEPTAPGRLVVYQRDIAGQGQAAPLRLDGEHRARLAEGAGAMRVAEIGMASKSVVAYGDLRGAPMIEGWAYVAWLEPSVGSARYIRLDALGSEEPRALDARTENLRLEDYGRLLVVLEPEATEPDIVPTGWLGFEAPLGVAPTAGAQSN